MKTMIMLILTTVVLTAGCTYTTNVTRDQRFERIMNARSVCAKERLRLYGIDQVVTSSGDRYDLTSIDRGPKNLIGYIDAGHKVRLKKINRHHDMGYIWEQLEGEVIFKGRLYPFCFYMGNSVYPDGWTRITDSFEVFR